METPEPIRRMIRRRHDELRLLAAAGIFLQIVIIAMLLV